MNLDDREDRTVAAAEYVIGTLAAPDRAVVERAMSRDPSFAREVGWWRDRTLPLHRLVTPLQPSPAVWRRIESALARTDSRTDSRAGPQRGAGRVPLLERLGFWRGFAIVATAALLTVTLRGYLPVFVEPGPRYVAVLESTEKRAGWVLEADARGRLRVVPVGPTTVDAGRALELWTIPAGAKTPRSLGLIPGDRVSEIDVSRLPGIVDRQHFAISLEPRGGSPTGQPTGPVLFAGDLARADGGR